MLTLSLNEVCEYTKATLSSRNMIEGQRVVNSGLIVVCGTTHKTADRIDLFSLCLRTSGLTLEPHTVTGTLTTEIINNNDSEVDELVIVKVMDCSCRAGKSHCCKHVVAVLLFCNRKDLDRLEILSSTDKKCLWKMHQKPQLEQYEAQPLRTFCCVNEDRLPPLPDSVLVELRASFIACDPETAIAKSSNRKRKSNQCDSQPVIPRKALRLLPNNNNITLHTTSGNVGTTVDSMVQSNTPSLDNFLPDFLENAEKSPIIINLNTTAVNMEDCCKKVLNQILKCENVLKTAKQTHVNKHQWLKERQFRITESRCYGIFTYGKDDWPGKARRYFWTKDIKTKAMHHGIMYEPVARQVYKEKTNQCVIECGLIVSKSEPWLAYSPDGIVMTRTDQNKLLEIKCPQDLVETSIQSILNKCKYLQLVESKLQMKKKHMYYAQIQFGMCLLNLTKCNFVIYSDQSNTIEIISVSFEEVYANKLMLVLKKNYFEKMIDIICKFSKTKELSCKENVKTVRV